MRSSVNHRQQQQQQQQRGNGGRSLSFRWIAGFLFFLLLLNAVWVFSNDSPSDRLPFPTIERCGFVFVISDPSETLCVLTSAFSLRVWSSLPIEIIHSGEVGDNLIQFSSDFFDIRWNSLDRLLNKDVSLFDQTLYGGSLSPRRDPRLSKIAAWKLGGSFEKVVLIDSFSLFTGNFDELCDQPSISAFPLFFGSEPRGEEITAAAKALASTIGFEKQPNSSIKGHVSGSSLMIFEPSEQTFRDFQASSLSSFPSLIPKEFLLDLFGYLFWRERKQEMNVIVHPLISVVNSQDHQTFDEQRRKLYLFDESTAPCFCSKRDNQFGSFAMTLLSFPLFQDAHPLRLWIASLQSMMDFIVTYSLSTNASLASSLQSELKRMFRSEDSTFPEGLRDFLFSLPSHRMETGKQHQQQHEDA